MNEDPTILGYRLDGSPIIRGVKPLRLGLATQRVMFRSRRWSAAAQLVWLTMRYLPEIVRLSEKRHEAGFDLYGCQMYDWPADTRRRNTLEELADAHCYLTSGPISRV